MFKKTFLKEFKSFIKSHKQRKENSIPTGILTVKAKPNNKPEKIISLNPIFDFTKKRIPTIVGKSIKISALAIFPSQKGIEVSIKKIKVAILEALCERKNWLKELKK